jgi:ubiquinone/menaquinone biosynthesis C-methylase UbiE
MRRAAGARELLDGPIAAADRAASFADIDRLNAWFGGYSLTLREVWRLAARAPSNRPLVVADVGGAPAAFARRLVDAAGACGQRVRVIVVDRDADGLRLAGAAQASVPGITLVQADATALPFRPGGVDIVTAGLTLHHLEPDDAAAGLAEMRAAARLGVVVNDLLRTRISLLVVWLATRALASHPISRHDGPLSVRRAYTPRELERLAERAGVGRLEVRVYPLLGRVVALAS